MRLKLLLFVSPAAQPFYRVTMLARTAALVALVAVHALAWDVARTPPMGFVSTVHGPGRAA